MDQENKRDILNQYCYPGTDVYINKLGIKKYEHLQQMELIFVSINTSNIENTPQNGNHDLDQWRSIHKFLFEDLYEWAGELRKNTVFDEYESPLSSPEKIEEGYQNIVRPLLEKTEHFHKSTDDSIVKDLSELMGELYYIHPFRDGNTRSLIQFARTIAQDAGFCLDVSHFDVNQWKALQDGIVRAAFDRNTDMLEDTLSGCISRDVSLIKNIKNVEIQNKSTELVTGSSYSAQIRNLFDMKSNQALNLESRLDVSVANQKKLLMKTMAQRPGLLASLWKGKSWKNFCANRQRRLNVLIKRLNQVRDIRTGMGGKRLEELARRKLQRLEPDLVSRHDAEERLRREQQADESLRLAREKKQKRSQGGARTLKY